MSLDLTPELETEIRQYAEREGVSVGALLSRAFPLPTLPSKPDHSGADEPAVPVPSLLRQWQQEYGLPPRPDGKAHTSVEELLAQWDQEDAHLTPEEADAEGHHWADHEKNHQKVSL